MSGAMPSARATGPSDPSPQAVSAVGSIPIAAVRVLVCGGRTFENKKLVGRTLRALNEERPIGCVIHGGARGADYLGKLWGETHGLAVIEMRANWVRFGKRAGPVRNQWMLDYGLPDVVVAFPGGVGTLDMIARAEKAGVRVIRASTPGDQIIQGLTEALAHASGIEAGTDETAQPVRPEGREPGPKGDAQ